MKLFTGWMLSAGLVLTAAAANAQVLEPYRIGGSRFMTASDMQGPMAAMPPEGPRYGLSLLPPPEVDGIVRESGFSPLGSPQLRGVVYTVSVLDRFGEDGRLVVDARTGRIISFMPANRLGDDLNEGLTENYGPIQPRSRPGGYGVLRPPANVPHVLASRTPSAALPKAAPHADQAKPLEVKPLEVKPLEVKPLEVNPLAARPAPARGSQSAAVQAKPADVPTAPPVGAPAAVEAKPALEPKPAIEAKPGAALIRPTQPLPEVQGLD
jgi:hypothetical protein